MRAFKLKARENWYGSLETAYIQITTPKGKTFTIEKLPAKKLKNKWTENEVATKLVWEVYERICQEIPTTKGFCYTIEMSREEVILFAKFSDSQIEI